MQRYSLRAARVQAGLSRTDAAKKLDVNAATIWRWERGIVSPPAWTAVRICALYGMNLDDIDWARKG